MQSTHSKMRGRAKDADVQPELIHELGDQNLVQLILTH